jgi:hypothetical protein
MPAWTIAPSKLWSLRMTAKATVGAAVPYQVALAGPFSMGLPGRKSRTRKLLRETGLRAELTVLGRVGTKSDIHEA